MNEPRRQQQVIGDQAGLRLPGGQTGNYLLKHEHTKTCVKQPPELLNNLLQKNIASDITQVRGGAGGGVNWWLRVSSSSCCSPCVRLPPASWLPGAAAVLRRALGPGPGPGEAAAVCTGARAGHSGRTGRSAGRWASHIARTLNTDGCNTGGRFYFEKCELKPEQCLYVRPSLLGHVPHLQQCTLDTCLQALQRAQCAYSRESVSSTTASGMSVKRRTGLPSLRALSEVPYCAWPA